MAGQTTGVEDDADAPSVRRFLHPLNWRPFFAEVDREVWLICIVAAVGLTLHELAFRSVHFNRLSPFVLPDALLDFLAEEIPPWRPVVPHIWWVGSTVLGWVVLPLVAARLLLGRRGLDYGLGWLGWRKMVPYATLLAAFIPVVAVAAFWLPGFRQSYPLYRGAWTGMNLLLFELVYGVQFFAVEFFFRGFLVNGLGRTLGYRAILVTMIPYVMIHFHKPFLEANAAIIAGIVLGAFALRTRSIWGGLLLHLGVAWSMDLFAILAGSRGGLPGRW